MKYLHPKRYWRKVIHWFQIAGFRVQCRRNHVYCEIGANTRLQHCRVRSKIDGSLIIGDGCTLHGVHFGFYGREGRIVLKDNIFINAYQNSRVNLFVKDGSSIVIDSNCLFSNTIDISTTDWHSVYDDEGRRLNPEKDVHIGHHVWVGRKVIIGKGVYISDDSVVGAGSVVTRSFSEPNVIIAGNPAEVKKRGIHW